MRRLLVTQWECSSSKSQKNSPQDVRNRQEADVQNKIMFNCYQAWTKAKIQTEAKWLKRTLHKQLKGESWLVLLPTRPKRALPN